MGDQLLRTCTGHPTIATGPRKPSLNCCCSQMGACQQSQCRQMCQTLLRSGECDPHPPLLPSVYFLCCLYLCTDSILKQPIKGRVVYQLIKILGVLGGAARRLVNLQHARPSLHGSCELCAGALGHLFHSQQCLRSSHSSRFTMKGI